VIHDVDGLSTVGMNSVYAAAVSSLSAFTPEPLLRARVVSRYLFLSMALARAKPSYQFEWEDKEQSHNCRTHSSCRVQAVGARGTRDNCKSKDKRSSA
jgi:hypothetical protein